MFSRALDDGTVFRIYDGLLPVTVGITKIQHRPLKGMVGPTELESVTSCVSSRRSNQLSYGPQGENF